MARAPLPRRPPQAYTGPVQISFKISKDTISRDLLRKLKAAANPKPALEAAGRVVVQRTNRAFDEPGVRPAPWQALAASTLARKAKEEQDMVILKAEGDLWKSARITEVSRSSVTVGTHSPYAKFHQLGTKRMPARPFFPFNKSGQLEEKAARRVEDAIRIKLGVDK